MTGDGSATSVQNGGNQLNVRANDGSAFSGMQTGSLGSPVSFTSSRTTDYFVSIRDLPSTSGRGQGDYILHVNMDDFISNNSATTGRIVANGMTSGRLDVTGDADWYRVSLTEGFSYGFRLTGDGTSASSSNARLSLIDATGQTVGGSDTYLGSGGLTRRIDSSGDYFVAVQTTSSSSNTIGNFQIHSVMTDNVRNDILTTANLTRNGVTNGVLDVLGDADWYRVTLTEGLSANFRLTGDGTSASVSDSTRIQLFSENGTPVGGSSIKTLNQNLGINPTAGGTYFLAVSHAYYGDNTGNFRVHTDLTDRVRADIGTNVTLASGQAMGGRIDSPVDQDWYKVRLTAGTAYRIEGLQLDSLSSVGGHILTLHDTNGARVHSTSWSSHAPVLNVTLTSGGGLFHRRRGRLWPYRRFQAAHYLERARRDRHRRA